MSNHVPSFSSQTKSATIENKISDQIQGRYKEMRMIDIQENSCTSLRTFRLLVSYSKPHICHWIHRSHQNSLQRKKAAEFHSCSLGERASQWTVAAHGVPLTPSQALSGKASMEQTKNHFKHNCMLEIISISNCITTYFVALFTQKWVSK